MKKTIEELRDCIDEMRKNAERHEMIAVGWRIDIKIYEELIEQKLKEKGE